MRLIDADALLEAIYKIYGANHAPQGIINLITNAPTVQREGWVSVPIEPTTKIISAMASSKALDDEGYFPALVDLINYSGENKNHTVLKAAYKAMIAAAPTETE